MLLCSLGASYAWCEDETQGAAPELAILQWAGGKPLYLEDFRGQVTVLCFFNDDSS